MRELIGDIERWRRDGRRVALARVVGVAGSGPRDPGAAMAVNEDGEVAGSVSGGCVEGAVVAEALAALEQGDARRCSFGYSDDQAFAVGLTCGGTVHLLVEPELPRCYESLRDAVLADEPVALATIVELGPPGDESPEGEDRDERARRDDTAARLLGASMLVRADGSVEGSLGFPELDAVVTRDASGALAGGIPALRHYGRCGEAMRRSVEVFVEVFAPPPRMVIIGAVDFTAALVKVAKVLGYRVTVADPRPVFATAVRFPAADEVVVDWPNRLIAKITPPLGSRDAICVLTHDPKFDIPAIETALGTEVGYLGAMGSRRTHAERVSRLVEAGVDAASLRRVMAPIGLDLGARTPEETAVSICAEIIALRTGRPAPSLRDQEGPIHHPAASRGPSRVPAPATAAASPGAGASGAGAGVAGARAGGASAGIAGASGPGPALLP
ncbi:MAG TPA: XdhC/CoxI family protein [Acidimicrobiales bacterium]|nr:XdhC/CoxI family protein [Acidimicrobiales bacterium]